jgi:hypothetical protein
MSENLPTSKTRKLTILIPEELFREFTIAALQEYGPRQKMHLILKLMRDYVEKSRERQVGPAVPQAISPSPQEGDEPT